MNGGGGEGGDASLNAGKDGAMKVKGTKYCGMQPAPKAVHPQPGVFGRGVQRPRLRRKRRGLGVSRSPGPWESEDLSGARLPCGPRAAPRSLQGRSLLSSAKA